MARAQNAHFLLPVRLMTRQISRGHSVRSAHSLAGSLLRFRLARRHLPVSLHVEVAAWADTYAALFANFALTPNCVCHVQPVRAEQPSEFGALARQGRVTGYPSDNHRITIFLSGLFLCFLNVGDRENASAVRAFGCGV